MSRAAVDAMLGDGVPPSRIVVVDTNPSMLEVAAGQLLGVVTATLGVVQTVEDLPDIVLAIIHGGRGCTSDRRRPSPSESTTACSASGVPDRPRLLLSSSPQSMPEVA